MTPTETEIDPGYFKVRSGKRELLITNPALHKWFVGLLANLPDGWSVVDADLYLKEARQVKREQQTGETMRCLLGTFPILCEALEFARVQVLEVMAETEAKLTAPKGQGVMPSTKRRQKTR